ncbi:MAG: DUF4355 domain-containing protein [Coprobacillus cateniformis]|nr:DUF4355 domain-containing protein [Coprobacillus cateniformis]
MEAIVKENKFSFPLNNLQLFAEDDPETSAADNDDEAGTDDHEADSKDTEQSEKTFTQSEIDKIVKGRIAKERKAWEKQLLDQQTEAEKLAGMSEKEKKEYQAKKKQEDLDAREAAITRRELTAQAKVQLADKGIPTELADVLDYKDADSCKKSIETVEKAFQTAVEKAVEERLKGGKPPKKAKDGTMSEADLIYKNMMGR